MAKEEESEIQACAKAIVSCFALFFPDNLREEAFSLSTNPNGKINSQKTDFAETFDNNDPFEIIRSLTNTFRFEKNIFDNGTKDEQPESQTLNDLCLFKIFELLFSGKLNIEERASLISTFRVLAKSHFECYGDKSYPFKEYIKKSYQLYCEASQTHYRINLFSDNFIGAYTEKIDLHRLNGSPDDTYSNDLYDDVADEYKDRCEKIPCTWSFTETKQRKLFLQNIYSNLRDLTKEDGKEAWGLLSFPEENSEEVKWKKIPDSNNPNHYKYMMVACTEENFINMFDGVTNEAPIKTPICGYGYCLSKFTDAFCDNDHNRSSYRSKFQEALRQLIVNGSGMPFGPKTLNKSNRNEEIRDKYKEIVENSFNKAILEYK